jgi:hypothetical protein
MRQTGRAHSTTTMAVQSLHIQNLLVADRRRSHPHRAVPKAQYAGGDFHVWTACSIRDDY